jgi:hypothetical protein
MQIHDIFNKLTIFFYFFNAQTGIGQQIKQQ